MKTIFESLPPAQTPAPSAREAERLQILTLVQQFEGMLLTEMLRDVRAGDDEDQDGSFGLGGATMNDTIQTEFGLALSRAGGLGMGDMLAKAFARQHDGAAAAGAVTPGAVVDRAGVGRTAGDSVGPLQTPAATPVVATPLLPDPASVHGHAGSGEVEGIDGPTSPPGSGLVLPAAVVTSNFGWRHDPLNGQARFHKGTDLRMAYGSEVRAAAPGVVQSVGDRTGYGLTVVVGHGDGRETRYAHLSAIDVAPGDPVSGGQLIARSGNSGRSTGAHLHFEAREFGRPVDPRAAAESWGGRKTDTAVGESDDSEVRY